MTLAEINHADYTPPRIEVHVDFRINDLVKAIPGARWDSDRKVWTIPRTWPSCLALRAEFGETLRIGHQLRAWAGTEAELKGSLASHRQDIEAPLPDLNGPGFDVLYPFQVVGARLASLARGYLLLDEQGTGKTRTALAALKLAQHRWQVSYYPAMVVCPKSMVQQWGREIIGFFPEADVSLVMGTPKKVTTALEPGHEFYVISYDLLRKYSRVAAFGSIELKPTEKVDHEIQLLGVQAVIADEVHRVRTPKSIQTRALWAASARAEFRLGLTGTPMQESPEDLWSLLRFIAPEEYPTKTPYVERFLDQSWNEWGGREIQGLLPQHAQEFLANFDTRTRRVTKAMALPFLPPQVYEVRWVDLPTRMRKAYKDMDTKLMAELEGGDILNANSVLVEAGRLIQLANASGEVETYEDVVPETGEIIERQTFTMTLPSPKIEAFLTDLDAGDFKGHSVVVYSSSRQLIELLSGEMLRKKIVHGLITGEIGDEARQMAVDNFQSGEWTWLLITDAGGEGLTLTAADTMVRLVRSWSFINHDQAEGRVHRIGSEVHELITMIDYITEDTVEEGQLIRLREKEQRTQEVLRDKDLLEAMQARLH